MAAAFSRRSVTVDDVVSTSDLPRSVIEACCTNKLPPLQEWLASGPVRVDACCGLPDLAVGAEVMARFHGGDEFYPATVVRGNANGTYAMAYKEHGLVWGEYEACPREQIRLAGSTVGGETPLILAAENNAIDCVAALLAAGADTNKQRMNGDTALIAACAHDYHATAELLLKHGARGDDGIVNCDGDSALTVASTFGASTCAALVLATLPATSSSTSSSTPKDSGGATPCVDGSKLLPARGTRRNAAGKGPVYLAATHNHLKTLNVLLSCGLSPDLPHATNGDTPIMACARSGPGHLACAARLLEACCNLELVDASSGDDVLCVAARAGNEGLVELLTEGHAPPPCRCLPGHRNLHSGDTALMLAVAKGSLACVTKLVHMPGAPLSAQNATGDSALTWAVWYGHQQIVQELLRAGAPPNLPTAKGETALMFAAYRNQPRLCSLLLDAGADPHARNANGDGPLALAAGCGNSPDCCRLLLGTTAAAGAAAGAAGASGRKGGRANIVDANVRDGQGHTPLMLAVGQGNMACAEVLLATGQVNLGCASVTGLTVQDFVEARHDAQVYSALIASYPTINKPEPAADASLPPPPPPLQSLSSPTSNGNKRSQKSATTSAPAAAKAPADKYNAGSNDDNDDDDDAVSVAATLSAAMAEGTNASEMLTLDWEEPQDARGSGGGSHSGSSGAAPDANGASSSSSTLLEHYDEATGQWQLLDVATQEATQGPLPPSSPLPLSLLRLFEALDVNHDGSLSKEEVVAAATNGLLEMTPQEAADFFHELDANGDGQVDRREFAHASSKLKPEVLRRAAKRAAAAAATPTTTTSDQPHVDSSSSRKMLPSSHATPDTSMDRDLALAYAIAEEERRHEENGRSGDGNNGSSGGGPRQKRIPRGSRTGPGLQYPGATSPTSPAKQPKAPPSPRPIRGQLVSVHLARLPDGKNFGITITQSPLEGVRVLNLAHKHEVLEVNDRIVEVNGIAVTGLSVREVAECVRKRKQDRILSLVVEKPRKWSIGRFFMRSEQRQEESLQRHVFGGSYPRTLHLTVIGAIGLPSLYPSAQYPNSYVEVTNRSTSTSFRTTVVRNNAFPVWEELVEVMVRSPDDQITVQLLAEPNFASTGTAASAAAAAASNAVDARSGNDDDDENNPIPGVGDETRRLSQKLRVPHYDKRFCCNREVSSNLAPFAHSPLLAAQLEAAGASASRPLMLRLKATWEESEQDRKLKAKKVLKQQRRQSAAALKTGGGLNSTDTEADRVTSAGFAHDAMFVRVCGLSGLPPLLWQQPSILAGCTLQLRNTATDQTLMTRPLLEAAEAARANGILLGPDHSDENGATATTAAAEVSTEDLLGLDQSSPDSEEQQQKGVEKQSSSSTSSSVNSLAGASLALDEFFVVNMRGAKDKVEFVLVAQGLRLAASSSSTSTSTTGAASAATSIPANAASSSTAANVHAAAAAGAAVASGGGQATVVGFATLPHYDDRVMFGTEVGLRVRLVDAIASKLTNSRDAKNCVLKMCATWADDPTSSSLLVGSGSVGGDDGDNLESANGPPMTPEKSPRSGRKSVASPSSSSSSSAAAANAANAAVYPKTLMVQVIGFKTAGGRDGDLLVGESSNLHVQVVNASTGQVNRTRTARNSPNPLFDEVFHVRVKSPMDRLVLHVLDRATGHQTADRLVGSAELLHAQAAATALGIGGSGGGSYGGGVGRATSSSGAASGSASGGSGSGATGGSGSARNRDLSLPVRLLDVRSGQWRTVGALQAAAMWESQAV